jgi:Asparagine synthase
MNLVPPDTYVAHSTVREVATPGLADRPVTVPDELRLTPLEELWGIPLGFDRSTPPLSMDACDLNPRAALGAAVMPALQHPPCTVSFSGGIDSSVVLAVATHVARREGLPAPIPVTNRFPGLLEADETQSQERVVSHLGLADWLRLDWNDELDVLGPIARTVLGRHGLLFPFNSFFHYPMLEHSAGGSLLTGIGGDELFTRLGRVVATQLLYERRRPRMRELRRLAYELSPAAIRGAVDTWRDESFDEFRWIRIRKRRELQRAAAAWQSSGPLRNDRALLAWWRSRMLQCGLASMRALAGDFGVTIAHPLADPGVLAALARAGGAVGISRGSRARGVKRLVGDLLPGPTLERQDKTIFDAAFWNEHARAFVVQWDGSGVNTEHVSVDALRAEWSKDLPVAQSFIQLQRAWLSKANSADRVTRPDA